MEGSAGCTQSYTNTSINTNRHILYMLGKAVERQSKVTLPASHALQLFVQHSTVPSQPKSLIANHTPSSLK
ncbi:hypothetical protein E2C01_074897 [Portunus trituberculatus]|uniref:Uncharacterized protein n=1 Tax=Portunus trituberculatus TaxID=210409 RepID=A0A5B7I716_PORTR|nr:hypothetical protein [Portunus trituberculatus]